VNSIASLAERIASETPRTIEDIILDANIEPGQGVFAGGSVVVFSESRINVLGLVFVLLALLKY
jgi:hypothetical protein